MPFPAGVVSKFYIAVIGGTPTRKLGHFCSNFGSVYRYELGAEVKCTSDYCDIDITGVVRTLTTLNHPKCFVLLKKHPLP